MYFNYHLKWCNIILDMACFVQVFIIYNTVKNFLPNLKLKNKLKTYIFFSRPKKENPVYTYVYHVCIFSIFLGEYNLNVQLDLTEHIKHLQCRSTDEIWNLYRISFLPRIMHCIVKTLWGWYGTVQILLPIMHVICVQHLELCQV